MKQFDPVQYRIFEGITGSQLYGTATPESDLDTRGVCIPPTEILLNPFENFEQKDSGFEEEDRSIYALGKFFKLCADANPNIVELLFIPENKILYNSKQWQYLLKYKQLFLSKKVRFTVLGYMFSQAKAIERHRQWFIDPPSHKPSRKDFGLLEVPLVTGDGLDAALNIPHELFKDEFRQELQNERNYRLAKKQWDNYISWQTNRNPKRKGYEEKWGYDLKYASHIMRLMQEGKELLLTGNITFPLPNAKELLEIKNGKYTYDEFMMIVNGFEKEFDIWHKQSILPNSPNRNDLTDLYFEILEMEK